MLTIVTAQRISHLERYKMCSFIAHIGAAKDSNRLWAALTICHVGA